jgi:bifunctional non-homologous end joining protein LigD
MEIVKSIELSYKEGSSDKVYQAFIKKAPTGFAVEFAYGRRGNTLNTGSKTTKLVTEAKADKIFDKIVNEKRSKGYKEEGVSNIELADHIETTDTGIRPQLLNDIDEDDLEKYLTNDVWCMQEKQDGRRRLLISNKEGNVAANRKGLSVSINSKIMQAFDDISSFGKKKMILDGEDMGDKVMVFDMISTKTYKERYEDLLTIKDVLPEIEVVYTAWTTEEKRKFLVYCRKTNAEGVVFKHIDAAYAPGKPNSGGSQMKYKFYATASCIVSKLNPNKRSVGISVYDGNKLITVGNVTVPSNKNIPVVGEIVEIKYLYYFPGGSLFQPVLLESRDDLDELECTVQKLKAKRPVDED